MLIREKKARNYIFPEGVVSSFLGAFAFVRIFAEYLDEWT